MSNEEIIQLLEELKTLSPETEVDGKIVSLDEQINELREKLNNYDNYRERVVTGNAFRRNNLNASLSTLEKDQVKLNASLNDKESELEKERVRLAENEKGLALYNEAIQRIENDYRNNVISAQQLERKQNERAAYASTNETLTANVSNLENEINDIRDEYNNKTSEVEEARTRLNEFEERVSANPNVNINEVMADERRVSELENERRNLILNEDSKIGTIEALNDVIEQINSGVDFFENFGDVSEEMITENDFEIAGINKELEKNAIELERIQNARMRKEELAATDPEYNRIAADYDNRINELELERDKYNGEGLKRTNEELIRKMIESNDDLEIAELQRQIAANTEKLANGFSEKELAQAKMYEDYIEKVKGFKENALNSLATSDIELFSNEYEKNLVEEKQRLENEFRRLEIIKTIYTNVLDYNKNKTKTNTYAINQNVSNQVQDNVANPELNAAPSFATADEMLNTFGIESNPFNNGGENTPEVNKENKTAEADEAKEPEVDPEINKIEKKDGIEGTIAADDKFKDVEDLNNPKNTTDNKEEAGKSQLNEDGNVQNNILKALIPVANYTPASDKLKTAAREKGILAKFKEMFKKEGFQKAFAAVVASVLTASIVIGGIASLGKAKETANTNDKDDNTRTEQESDKNTEPDPLLNGLTFDDSVLDTVVADGIISNPTLDTDTSTEPEINNTIYDLNSMSRDEIFSLMNDPNIDLSSSIAQYSDDELVKIALKGFNGNDRRTLLGDRYGNVQSKIDSIYAAKEKAEQQVATNENTTNNVSSSSDTPSEINGSKLIGVTERTISENTDQTTLSQTTITEEGKILSQTDETLSDKQVLPPTSNETSNDQNGTSDSENKADEKTSVPEIEGYTYDAETGNYISNEDLNKENEDKVIGVVTENNQTDDNTLNDLPKDENASSDEYEVIEDNVVIPDIPGYTYDTQTGQWIPNEFLGDNLNQMDEAAQGKKIG